MLLQSLSFFTLKKCKVVDIYVKRAKGPEKGGVGGKGGGGSRKREGVDALRRSRYSRWGDLFKCEILSSDVSPPCLAGFSYRCLTPSRPPHHLLGLRPLAELRTYWLSWTSASNKTDKQTCPSRAIPTILPFLTQHGFRWCERLAGAPGRYLVTAILRKETRYYLAAESRNLRSFTEGPKPTWMDNWVRGSVKKGGGGDWKQHYTVLWGFPMEDWTLKTDNGRDGVQGSGGLGKFFQGLLNQ